jgi:hypothetical protein
MMTQRSIDEWLSLAYQNGEKCPPPELFLEAEWEALSDEQRQATMSHAETCPACAAERDLARAFDAPATASDEADAGIEEVLATIKAADSSPVSVSAKTRPEVGRLVRFPAMAKVFSQPALSLAAAAVAVLAVGLVLQTRSATPPVLPNAPVTDVTRGGRVETVAPVGVVEAVPETLTWEAVEGAARYRVSLTAVDDTVLWQGETTQESILLGDEVRSELQPAVVYFWQVDAFSEVGFRVAWSAAVEFRVDPAATEEMR